MEKNYTHTLYEDSIYQQWESSGSFNPDNTQKKFSEIKNQKRFSIIMPPPNANDPLHVGHALFITLEDILIRFHRMKGEQTLWLPGADHAGIETQFVFEKKLAKNGLSRFQFDAQSLYKMIYQYVQENSTGAVNQMKKLGASADWSRFTFTLDTQVVEFVHETFEKLYQDGLVYRDVQLVNFSVKLGTSFSELEVKYKDQISALYYIKYRVLGSSSQNVVVATTRPEPIFVDTHLAVHPDDSRYQDLIGKQVLNPLTDLPMTIIADHFVDPEFGTGVVKLTPAHDRNDFEVAKRHNLPIIQAIDTRGRIMSNGGKYAQLSVQDARKQVVADLEKKGLIDKIDEKYQNRVGFCYKTDRPIELIPMSQFFIKVEPLAQKALEALDNKETLIHGAGREKILRHWLENLRDWNISRQTVWGIRLPVWYSIAENPDLEVTFLDLEKNTHSGKISELLEQHGFEEIQAGLQSLRAPADAKFVVSPSKPTSRSGTQPAQYLQETDTFDTWFSSAQWPVVTLKTRQNLELTRKNDFERFYPTNVMETGYDILPFWVMRMMMMGIYLTGKSPFQHVYLHGLVRDEKGRKMSKSVGNVINPLVLVEKYGADALRMALVMSTTAGNDSAVGEQKVRGMRNFSNKIWNASRFILLESEKRVHYESQQAKEKSNDAQFIRKLHQIHKTITTQLDSLKIGLAAETIHNEFWHWYCDVCLEDVKNDKLSYTLAKQGLLTFLHLLHPFMPFVTEVVYQELKKSGIVKQADSNGLLINQPWMI